MINFYFDLGFRRELQEVDEIGKKIKREIESSNLFYDPNLMGRRNNNNNNNLILSSSSSSQSSGISNLNTITPCAACKLLRRRCAQECPFSPYFSPHEPHKFASVHKVFGASNVAKMLMVRTLILFFFSSLLLSSSSFYF